MRARPRVATHRHHRRLVHALPGHRAGRRGGVLRACSRCRRWSSRLAGAIGYVSDALHRRPGRRRAARRSSSCLPQALTDGRSTRSSARPSTTVLRRRALRRDLGRLRAGAVVGLARAQRLRRHHHDHARARRAPGDRQDPGAVVRASTCWRMVTGVVSDPAGGGRPDAGRRWLPERFDFLICLLLADGAACSASASWPRSTTCPCRCGPTGASTCPARCSPWSAGSPGSYVLRWVLTVTAADSRSIYGPLAAPIAVLLWLYLAGHRGAHRGGRQRRLRHGLPAAEHDARPATSSCSGCASASA